MLTEQIKEKAEQCREEIIQFRRELHRHPELSMEEYETSHKIAEKLRSLEGMEVITGAAGGTGVVGILTGAKGAGKTVLLRADIDALPIEEKTGLRRTCCVAFRQCNDSVKAAQPVFRSREICIPAR